MDDRESLEVREEVLEQLVLLANLSAAEAVQGRDTAEDVVDEGNDDRDTDRVGPDTNDRDNVRPSTVGSGERVPVGSAREPAEETEDGRDGVDTQDGANKLPAGERDVRLATAETGDKDEPVLGERNLEEENLLGVAEVLDDTTVVQEQGSAEDPGTTGKKETEDDRNEPDLGQLPLDGGASVRSVVVGDGDRGNVGEQGDEDDEVSADHLVEDDDREDKVDFEVETERDTVLDVSLHAVENLTGDLDGGDDRRETLVEEDDVGSRASSVRGTFDSDTTVSLLERGSVVDTVTSPERGTGKIVSSRDFNASFRAAPILG